MITVSSTVSYKKRTACRHGIAIVRRGVYGLSVRRRMSPNPEPRRGAMTNSTKLKPAWDDRSFMDFRFPF